MTSIYRILLVLSLLSVFVSVQPARAASGVVQPPCDEAAFDDAFDAVQSSGGGTLTFNCGFKTITFSIEKTVYSNVTIDGGDLVTLDGGVVTRLFYVNLGSTLTLDHITLNGGSSSSDGGAVFNEGTLEVQNSKFTNNYAFNLGGAIASIGTLHVTASEFANNQAYTGGAIHTSAGVAHITNTDFNENQANSGGAVASTGEIEITASDFSENQAYQGGAVYAHEYTAQVTINDSHFSQNRVDSAGGAIMADESSSVTVSGGWLQANGAKIGATINGGAINTADLAGVTLENVTLSGNSAFYGGGINNFGTTWLTNVTLNDNTAEYDGGGIYSYSTLNLFNVTLQNNSAINYGGGIRNDGTATLSNVTLSGNHAYGGGGIFNSEAATLQSVTLSGNYATFGGGINTNGGNTNLRNTVIAHGIQGVNCYKAAGPGSYITSINYNLSDDASCAADLNQTHDRNSMDARLGALLDNGGTTLTHLPEADSPLVDQGECQFGLELDQRGVSRPQGAACDTGAVERRVNEGGNFTFLPVVLR